MLVRRVSGRTLVIDAMLSRWIVKLRLPSVAKKRTRYVVGVSKGGVSGKETSCEVVKKIVESLDEGWRCV